MRYAWLILLLCLPLTGVAQKSATVRQLERQRKEALAAIEETNRLLKETQATAQNSLKRLDLLSRQILSRKRVISLLSREMEEIEGQMAGMKRDLTRLNGELEQKRDNYGRSARNLYRRHTSQDKLLFILSAESFGQSLRRMRYLREYADWQKRQAKEILEKRDEIAAKRLALEKSRAEKQALLGTREAEQQKLAAEEASQQAEVSRLGKKEKELQARLARKRRQAEALDRQIEKQIAAEIARAEAEARAARQPSGTRRPTQSSTPPAREERKAEVKGGYAMTREEKKLSDNFSGNRGRLPYPVTGRATVVATFGEQQHQTLKYVRTSNNGIDLQAAPGADARAVFNGVVTRVFVVPGYNNSVIVRHGNYLTVYSNLGKVYVKAGDKVSTRQPLGKIFTDREDHDATLLHFQLWKEKNKLDPLPWLE